MTKWRPAGRRPTRRDAAADVDRAAPGLRRLLQLPPELRHWAGMVSAASGLEALQQQVADTECRFARSMADRDHAAFTALLSEQAVFLAGPQVLRGKIAVAAGWRRFFDGPAAPFAWTPDRVEVLADGTLALSTGPVRDPAGHVVARFNSIWRQEAPGVWRVVFDKGQPPDPPSAG